MQSLASTDPAAGFVGGRTFKLTFAANSMVPGKDIVAGCPGCHNADLNTRNFPLRDYDGDGVIDGAQTEVQHLLDPLALLPPVGPAKSSLAIASSGTQPQLDAAYNYLFVHSDGSLGIHNMAYTVGLLKASIADLKTRSGKYQLLDHCGQILSRWPSVRHCRRAEGFFSAAQFYVDFCFPCASSDIASPNSRFGWAKKRSSYEK